MRLNQSQQQAQISQVIGIIQAKKKTQIIISKYNSFLLGSTLIFILMLIFIGKSSSQVKDNKIEQREVNQMKQNQEIRKKLIHERQQYLTEKKLKTMTDINKQLIITKKEGQQYKPKQKSEEKINKQQEQQIKILPKKTKQNSSIENVIDKLEKKQQQTKTKQQKQKEQQYQRLEEFQTQNKLRVYLNNIKLFQTKSIVSTQSKLTVYHGNVFINDKQTEIQINMNAFNTIEQMNEYQRQSNQKKNQNYNQITLNI